MLSRDYDEHELDIESTRRSPWTCLRSCARAVARRKEVQVGVRLGSDSGIMIRGVDHIPACTSLGIHPRVHPRSPASSYPISPRVGPAATADDDQDRGEGSEPEGRRASPRRRRSRLGEQQRAVHRLEREDREVSADDGPVPVRSFVSTLRQQPFKQTHMRKNSVPLPVK